MIVSGCCPDDEAQGQAGQGRLVGDTQLGADFEQLALEEHFPGDDGQPERPGPWNDTLQSGLLSQAEVEVDGVERAGGHLRQV